MEGININPLGLRAYKLLVCFYGNCIQSSVFLDSYEITTDRKNHMAPVCPTKHVHMITFYIWLLNSSSHECSKLCSLVLVHIWIVYIWTKEGGRKKVGTPPFLDLECAQKVLRWSRGETWAFPERCGGGLLREGRQRAAKALWGRHARP